MVWLVIVLMSLVTLVLASQTEELLTVSREYQKITREAAQISVTNAVHQYFKESGSFPDSLKSLTAIQGYSPLKMYLKSSDGGYLSGDSEPAHLRVAPAPGSGDPLLNDGAWQFQRIAIYSLFDRITSPDYFIGATQNKCGSGASYSQAISWCGDSAFGIWSRLETRDEGVARITAIKEGQIRTLAKFVGYFNVDKAFPDPGATVALKTLVGVTSPATCTGRYQWNGIPLDCTDLFNVYNKDILISRASLKDLMLYSETPLKDNTGEAIIIGSSLNL